MESSKYIQIIENIHKELISIELSDNIGLHSGTSGLALFIAYYNRIIHKKNIIDKDIITILEHSIECINSGISQHTICSGISGFGWLCEHLKELGMLKKKSIEFLDDLDSFLYRQMIIDIKEGNYDYLHGALGVGTYFLCRCNRKEIFGYIEELLAELEKSSIPCNNNAVKWLSVIDYETGRRGYNISLSHGMSSIVAFLIRLHQLNFEQERVAKLLVQTITYIFDQRTFVEGSLSYFPSFSKDNKSGYNDSRLGWCYGDLGITHILWRAAIVLNNKDLENTAIRILCYNTNRRDLQINGVNDAGLCHGCGGIAYIFGNLFFNTGVHVFQEAAEHWLKHTVEMAKYPDGLAGFKSWRADNFGEYVISENMLTGIAGIGLVFLSCLNSNDTAWDKCLMLS